MFEKLYEGNIDNKHNKSFILFKSILKISLKYNLFLKICSVFISYSL